MLALENGHLASYSVNDTIRIFDLSSTNAQHLLTFSGHGNTKWLLKFGILSNGNLVTCSRSNGTPKKSYDRYDRNDRYYSDLDSDDYEDEEEENECFIRVRNPEDGTMVKNVSTGLEKV